jgi:hypothetical protein
MYEAMKNLEKCSYTEIKTYVKGFLEKEIPKTKAVLFGIENEEYVFQEYQKLHPEYKCCKSGFFDDSKNCNA